MRIAAHDLGSNSFHSVVVEVHTDGTFHEVSQEKEMLRLGSVVAQYGRLTEEAIDRATITLKRMRALASSAGADEQLACATSALREAENGPEVVAHLEAATGLRIQVISGRDEARLIFAAVRASVSIDLAPAVCLDLGGGSLEVSVGDRTGLKWCTSLHLGVGRLATDVGDLAKFGRKEQRALRERVVAALAPAALAVDELAPRMMIVTSGTLLDLVRLALQDRDGSVPLSINNARVSRKELQRVHRRLLEATGADRSALAGVDLRRGDVLPLGSTLLQAALDVFGLDAVTAGEWALREGIILDAIDHHDPADWSGDALAMRRASVLSLCRRCNWAAAHSRHVSALATALFDQTQTLHGMGDVERELLEHAAMLHDIGEHVAASSHHKHTSYLIRHGALRGFAPDEINLISALARYHRRSEPKSEHEPYRSLPDAMALTVTNLAGFLRVADGLDRGHAGTVSGVSVAIEAKRVVITAVSARDADDELEVWGGRRKKAMMEKLLGRPIEIVAG